MKKNTPPEQRSNLDSATLFESGAVQSNHNESDDSKTTDFHKWADHLAIQYALDGRHLLRAIVNERIIPFFGCFEAGRITELDIDQFCRERYQQGALVSDLNLELFLLKVVFHNGLRRQLISKVPRIDMISDANLWKLTGDIVLPEAKASTKSVADRKRRKS